MCRITTLAIGEMEVNGTESCTRRTDRNKSQSNRLGRDHAPRRPNNGTVLRTATKSTTTDGAAEEQDFRGVAVERKAVNEVGRDDDGSRLYCTAAEEAEEGGVVVGVVCTEPSQSRLCEECLMYVQICGLSVRWKN